MNWRRILEYFGLGCALFAFFGAVYLFFNRPSLFKPAPAAHVSSAPAIAPVTGDDLAAQLEDSEYVPLVANIDSTTFTTADENQEIYLRNVDAYPYKQSVDLVGFLVIKPDEPWCSFFNLNSNDGNAVSITWKCEGSKGPTYHTEILENIRPVNSYPGITVTIQIASVDPN